MLNAKHLNALTKFANHEGRRWREALASAWATGNYPRFLTMDETALLQQVRNSKGPDFLVHFKPIEGDFEKVGYLKKDRQERFNLKRGWFVTAWRIVDAEGKDLVQPWSNTKGEARETAKSLKIFLLAEE